MTRLLQPRDERLPALERRVSELEQKPSVKDAGIWRAGAVYGLGDIVTMHGSAWICSAPHVAVGADLDHARFRLLVKKGRDARDAR